MSADRPADRATDAVRRRHDCCAGRRARTPGFQERSMTRSVWFGFAALVIASNAYGQQMIGSCPVLPANNIWNTPVDTLPVLSNSASMVTTIGASTGFHPDFGTFAGY